MKNQTILLATILYVVLATLSPAWADDPPAASAGADPSGAAAIPAPNTGSGAAGVSKPMRARLASWPLSIAGFACGTVVGTPICFVRKLPSEWHNLAYGFTGSITDNQNKLLSIPAGIAWLPFSATAALMEAPVYAFKDAYMAEKPFSKEQFSLGQLDAPNKK